MENTLQIIDETRKWIDEFIITHSICPFAAHVVAKDQVFYHIEEHDSEHDQIVSLFQIMEHLTTDTAFVIFPTQYPDYLCFLDFYYICESLLEQSTLDDTFQIVAFHPSFLFDQEAPNDPSHETNRSPYPMIHILQKDQVKKAIEDFGDTSKITERNVAFLRSRMTEDQDDI